MLYGKQKINRITDDQGNLEESFSVIIVSADGQAPSGARPSAGTVMY